MSEPEPTWDAGAAVAEQVFEYHCMSEPVHFPSYPRQDGLTAMSALQEDAEEEDFLQSIWTGADEEIPIESSEGSLDDTPPDADAMPDFGFDQCDPAFIEPDDLSSPEGAREQNDERCDMRVALIHGTTRLPLECKVPPDFKAKVTNPERGSWKEGMAPSAGARESPGDRASPCKGPSPSPELPSLLARPSLLKPQALEEPRESQDEGSKVKMRKKQQATFNLAGFMAIIEAMVSHLPVLLRLPVTMFQSIDAAKDVYAVMPFSTQVPYSTGSLSQSFT